MIDVKSADELVKVPSGNGKLGRIATIKYRLAGRILGVCPSPSPDWQ
jgi:hypothetical protein